MGKEKREVQFVTLAELGKVMEIDMGCRVDFIIGGRVYQNIKVRAMNIPEGEVLIGMDFISRGRMAIDHTDEEYTFQFELPDTL